MRRKSSSQFSFWVLGRRCGLTWTTGLVICNVKSSNLVFDSLLRSCCNLSGWICKSCTKGSSGIVHISRDLCLSMNTWLSWLTVKWFQISRLVISVCREIFAIKVITARVFRISSKRRKFNISFIPLKGRFDQSFLIANQL